MVKKYKSICGQVADDRLIILTKHTTAHGTWTETSSGQQLFLNCRGDH